MEAFRDDVESTILKTKLIIEEGWDEAVQCESDHPCCQVSEVVWDNLTTQINQKNKLIKDLQDRWDELEQKKIDLVFDCPDVELDTCWDGTKRTDAGCPVMPENYCQEHIEIMIRDTKINAPDKDMNEIIHYLNRCEKEIDVDAQRPDHPGCTLEVMAVHRNLTPVVAKLIKMGADPNKGCRDSGTIPLNAGASFLDKDQAKYDPSRTSETMINMLAYQENLDMYHSDNEYEWTFNPMHTAVRFDNLELLKIFVEERGADPTIPQPNGQNLLERAKAHKHDQIVEYLEPYF